MHKVELSDVDPFLFLFSKFELLRNVLKQKIQALSNRYNTDSQQQKINNQIKADILRQWLDHLHPTALHKERYIYAIWGALDGVTIAQGLLKTIVDAYTRNNYQKLINNYDFSGHITHKIFSSPYGIALVAAETLAVTVFSIIGNGYDDDKEKLANWKKYTVRLWGYFRIAAKNTKNTQRILKDFAELLKAFNLNHALVPSIILSYMVVFSLLTMVTMSFTRYLGNIRKDMTSDNNKVLQTILLNKLTVEEIENQRIRINQQIRRADPAALHYILTLYNHIFNSLYLYAGALTLCALPLPILILLIIFISLYSVLHIISSFFDEYGYQTKLTIAQLEIQLALLDQEINDLLDTSCDIAAIQQQLAEFIKLRERLYSHSNSSDKTLVLAGLKNGMASYRALMAVMFLTAAVVSLFSLALPSAMVISFVISGALLVIGFTGYTYQKSITTTNTRHSLYQAWQEDLRTLQKAKVEDIREYKQKILFNKKTGWEITSQDASMLGIESVRLGFAGFRKGTKTAFMDQIMSSFHDPNNKTHTENIVLLVIMGISAVLHAIIFALRQYSRDFGRNSASISTAQQIIPTDNRLDSKSTLEKIYKENKTVFFAPRANNLKAAISNSLNINEPALEI